MCACRRAGGRVRARARMRACVRACVRPCVSLTVCSSHRTVPSETGAIEGKRRTVELMQDNSVLAEFAVFSILFRPEVCICQQVSFEYRKADDRALFPRQRRIPVNREHCHVDGPLAFFYHPRIALQGHELLQRNTVLSRPFPCPIETPLRQKPRRVLCRVVE